MTNYTEQNMVDLFIEKKRYRASKIFVEIPVYSRSVDVVVYNKNRNEITAIEFKKHKWHECLQQIERIQNSFDFLCICMIKPKTQTSEQSIVNKCKEMGIGLYLIDMDNNKVIYLVKPIKNRQIWKLQKNYIVKNIYNEDEKHD